MPSFYVYVVGDIHVCAGSCTCMQVYMCVYAVCGQRSTAVFETKSLSGTWGSLNLLGLMDSKSLTPTFSASAVLG